MGRDRHTGTRPGSHGGSELKEQTIWTQRASTQTLLSHSTTATCPKYLASRGMFGFHYGRRPVSTSSPGSIEVLDFSLTGPESKTEQ